MFHPTFRMIPALALLASTLFFSPVQAALVTLPVDTANSTVAVGVQVTLGGVQLATANLQSRWKGNIIIDVQRNGLMQITSIQFVNGSTTHGTLTLEDITGINVDLAALGNVPATLVGAEFGLAVRNVIGTPPTGQTISDDAPLAVSPIGVGPLGDIIYGGNPLGQDITSTDGIAKLGPATGPIAALIGPGGMADAKLVDPTGSTGQLATGQFKLFDGVEKPNRLELPIDVSLPGVLSIPAQLLAVNLRLQGTLVAVPEASSFVMMGAAVGLFGLLGGRRLARRS
jgi:hypothetical protein